MGTENTRRQEDSRHKIAKELLETLASDYASDKDSVSTRVPGTCEWFSEDDRFLTWRESKISRLLWVSAGPGCGKSVLARALIDERRVCTNMLASTVCYFFFMDGHEQRSRGTDALSAILHQLFENTALITYALPIYDRYGGKLRDAFSQLWEILAESAKDSHAGEIVCILDALDECEEVARNQLIEKLIHFCSQESCQKSSSNLKFLVTSRPYDDLQQKFQRLSDVSTYIRFDGDEKSQKIGQEINLVIDAKIPHLTGGFNEKNRERISNRLKEMDNRTYLWLFLTIDIIERSPSRFRRKSDIDSLLSSLPSKISDAYERILSRSEDEDKARMLLELIVAATRPLSLQEANMALAIATRSEDCRSEKDLELWPLQNFTTTIQNICGLFVSVHDGKLFLIHQTAREFLVKRPGSASMHKWKECFEMAAAHGTMSRICLDYLNFQDVTANHRSQDDEFYIRSRQLHEGDLVSYGPLRDDLAFPAFLPYAANNWVYHYTSQPGELAKDSQEAAKRLCNASSPQGYWLSVWSATRHLRFSKGTELMIASLLGLTNVVEEVLSEEADVNAQSGGHGSALYAASEGGHGQIVQMLLDKGANVNAQGGRYNNALQAASFGGHDEVVQMLLDEGADVNARGGRKCDRALQAAISGGHDRIVAMLLVQGASPVGLSP